MPDEQTDHQHHNDDDDEWNQPALLTPAALELTLAAGRTNVRSGLDLYRLPARA